MPQLNVLIRTAIAQGRRLIIANHNLHSLYLVHHNVSMQAFYTQADCVHVDGMGIIALARMMGHRLERDHRITYVDWIRPLMSEAAGSSWRVFYLGSKPGVAEAGARVLRSQFPALTLETAHGYFDMRPGSLDNRKILEAIDHFRPHVLMVGMGMPRQECWVDENLARIAANVILTSGAAMDYVAGVVPTPPRWAGHLGLEWLFRLCAEPRRLWKRYLIEPWYLAALLAKSYLALNFKQHSHNAK